MGGGSSSGSRSLGDTRHLENRAKEILQQGGTGRKNVFISFAYEDIAAVTLLRGQAKNDNSPIDFTDRSVNEPFNSERRDYIQLKLRERINQASMTLVFLSGDTGQSEWVRWEVEKSLELGKQVIAIHSGEAPPIPLPDFIVKNKIKVTPWSDLAKELAKR